MIDPREYRNALGRFATGVTVVTMEDRGVPYGITVNAFLSASLVPPMIAICIDRRANAHATLFDVERFAVSILNADQRDISERFAGRPDPEGDPYVRVYGLPMIAGALAHLACRIEDRVAAGDHTLFVAAVEYLDYREDGTPLLYYRGNYGVPS